MEYTVIRKSDIGNKKKKPCKHAKRKDYTVNCIDRFGNTEKIKCFNWVINISSYNDFISFMKEVGAPISVNDEEKIIFIHDDEQAVELDSKSFINNISVEFYEAKDEKE